jgi:hypothetical protein
MRKKVWITSSVVVLTCISFLLLKAMKRPGTISSGSGDVVPVSSSESEVATENRRRAIGSAAESNLTTGELLHLSSGDSNALVAQAIAEWQQPIEFYGKVVDENGKAIAGANVRFHWASLTEDEGVNSSTTESDANGLFFLRDKLGPSLTVWVTKEGYFAFREGQQAFSYALTDNRHAPNPQDPVIFRLRKKGQGEELVTSAFGSRHNFPVQIPRDGRPVKVDLVQRKSGVSGDLTVSQFKPARGQERQATEWSFHLSIPDGGLIEHNEEFPFTAPAEGYQSTVDLHFLRTETNWITHFIKNYYIAFGEPRKYGWLRVESDISQETIFLTYAINPSGSQNLEPAN